MIEVTRFNEKWRLAIKNEVLEFNSRADLDKALTTVLSLKEDNEPEKEQSNLPAVEDVMKTVMDLIPKKKTKS